MSKTTTILIGLLSVIIFASPTTAQTAIDAPTTRMGQPMTADEYTKKFPALQADFGFSDAEFAAWLPTIMEFIREFPTLQADLSLNDADFAVLLPKMMKASTANRTVGGKIYQPKLQLSAAVLQRMPAPIPWRHLPQARTAIGYAWFDLIDAVNDPNMPEDVIKTKLDAYHAARAAALADARIAKEELRAFVKLRQEAVLVSYGFLD